MPLAKRAAELCLGPSALFYDLLKVVNVAVHGELGVRWQSTEAAARSSAVEVPQVSAELAYYVSRRHVGLVDMPPEVKETLDKFVIGAGLKGRRLRQFGRKFTDHLKQLSRTQSRGGITDWIALESRRSKQRKRRELEIALGTLNGRIPWNHPLLSEGIQESMQNRTANTPNPSKMSDKSPLLSSAAGQGQTRVQLRGKNHLSMSMSHPGVIQETPAPSYEELTTAAYAATRFPGTFAAIVRVFDELKARLPSFKPDKLLDFGSGPGTTIWAVQEVWENFPSQVLAVEPSWPMVALGQEIEKSRKKAELMGDCKIRWVSQLPSIKGSDSHGSQKRRYNISVASYVLSEIPEAHDRRRIARLLWERTNDLLVFIEPGTPVGAANIQEVRSHILELERKKFGKMVGALPGDIPNKDNLAAIDADSLAESRLNSAGCHIVAPCPHDGTCPMTGKKMWCHFNQRFLRTRAQKVTKIRPDKQHGPRDFQDERFSYIVFRRGWREKPSKFTDVRVAADFYQDIKPDEENEYTPMKYRNKQDKPWVVEDSSSEDEDPVLLPPVDLGKLDPGTRNLIHRAILGDADESETASPLWERVSLEALVERLESAAPLDQNDPDETEDDLPDETLMSPADVQMLGPDVPGTDSSSLLATSDVGKNLSDRSASENADPNNNMETNEITTQVELPDRLSEVHLIDWPTLSPQDFALTAHAAQRWSRIIRPPRRRSGHVIIDVCTSSEVQTKAGHKPSIGGKLQRHIVSRSDMNSYMGRAGFRLAKKSRWGDLWPTYYNSNRKIIDI